MSTTTSSVGSANVVQNLTQTLLAQFDADGNTQLSPGEFEKFLQKLVASLSGAGSSPTSLSSSAASLLSGAASASAPVGNYEFRGFDTSRAVSAAGTLKYDAYNVLQRYDPADPASMQRAYSELSVIHPGQYELDSQDNLMLTGTADGYIGARPDDRNSDWTNRNQPWNWSWMAYNSAHPGPNGEGLT